MGLVQEHFLILNPNLSADVTLSAVIMGLLCSPDHDLYRDPEAAVRVRDIP